jgi:hypothetical protein
VFVTVTAYASPAPARTAAGGRPATGATIPAATSLAAETIIYTATGSPADVTYGPSGSRIKGHSPITITAKLGNAGYYRVGAQLGSSDGAVTVEILVNGKVIRLGTALRDAPA